MDEILKYHRILGPIRDRIKNDKIKSADIGSHAIAIGTEEGFVHILSLEKNFVSTIKAHSRCVNGVSLDSHCQVLGSCSDDGTVMLHSVNSEDEKSPPISFNETVKAIVIDTDENPKKDKSVMIGTGSGKLIHHKQVWFTHKNVVMFNGNGSPVIAISWRGDIVAWADLTVVRLMNISTQTAVCFVNAPSGVGAQNPFPCHFYWESNSTLLIAWADSLRSLELVQIVSSSGRESEVETTVKMSMDYQLDCIACGVSSFDVDHLVLFGYVPPEEDAVTRESDVPNHMTSVSNQPEVKIIKRSNGDIISSDVLPMQGQVWQGPWDYHFLSSFMIPYKSKDFKKWRISDIQSSFSSPDESIESYRLRNNRGMSPIIIILSPNDIVQAKVRDVNDRIGIALQNGDLLTAINLAWCDQLSLRYYHFDELISLYIEDIIERGDISFAVSECARLIRKDASLWERWSYFFIKRGYFIDLLKYIPVNNPRLSAQVYETFLESLLSSDTALFLETIEKWGRIRPPLFNHASVINHLEASKRLDPYGIESLAQLHLWNRNYEKALNYYLDINYADIEQKSRATRSASDEDIANGNLNDQINMITVSSINDLSIASNMSTSLSSLSLQEESTSNKNQTNHDKLIITSKSEERANFIHVFDLIEKEKLYENVRDKIINLFRLSKDLSANFLARHVEKFPVSLVVKQLKVEKRYLHYYLHYMFMKYDAYNNDRSYADFHVMQVSLYAEFAPAFVRPVIDENSPWGTESNTLKADSAYNQQISEFDDNFAELLGLRGKNHRTESHFMTFLRLSKFYPVDYALRECEKRKPPLYHEMIYILDLKGMRREALNLLLKEIGDVREAVDFIERHEDTQQLELWNDLVEYSIKNHNYLSGLLDYLGICNLDADKVILSIPKSVQIPGLRQKILRILKQYKYQVFLTEKCNMILEEDALDSLKRLKQGQRKAMKVAPASRCSKCGKPLFVNPGNVSSNVFTDSLLAKYNDPSYQVWGKTSNNNHTTGLVIFSSKVMFHRLCFDVLSKSSSGNSSKSLDP